MDVEAVTVVELLKYTTTPTLLVAAAAAAWARQLDRRVHRLEVIASGILRKLGLPEPGKVGKVTPLEDWLDGVSDRGAAE